MSLKPLKLPVATNMARLTGAAIERQRRYVMAISATSPFAFIAVTQTHTGLIGVAMSMPDKVHLFVLDALKMAINNALTAGNSTAEKRNLLFCLIIVIDCSGCN